MNCIEGLFWQKSPTNGALLSKQPCNTNNTYLLTGHPLAGTQGGVGFKARGTVIQVHKYSVYVYAIYEI
jgi:hypothetical protein